MLSLVFGFSACSDESSLLPTAEVASFDDVYIVNENDYSGIDWEINPINLEVKIVEGIPTFETLDDFSHAIDVLAEHSEVDILSWSVNQGFHSLYVDLHSNLEAENEEEDSFPVEPPSPSGESLVVQGEEGAELKASPLFISQLTTPEGYVSIDGLIGVLSLDLQVWAEPDQFESLKQAINTGSVEDLEGFIVINDSRDPEFNQNGLESRDAYYRSSLCPLRGSTSITTGKVGRQDEKPASDGKSRFQRLTYDTMQTVSGREGSQSLRFDFFMKSESFRKKKKRSYRTDHYFLYDFVSTSFSRISPVRHQITSRIIHSRTSVAEIKVNIVNLSLLTRADLLTFGREVRDVNPGVNNNQTSGTWASHQGMGNGNFLRVGCN